MVKKSKYSEPVFTRGDVAKILNVTPMTIRNRERADKYPPPTRDLNGYRVYTLNDLFTLQLITNASVDPRPVLSLLYDRGYRDMREVGQMIDQVLTRRRGLG